MTGGDVPAWFVQALREALDPLETKMDKLMTDMQTVKRISSVVSCSVLLYIIFNLIHTQLFNRSHGSGDDTVLEVVPFKNGDDPTKPPV